MRTLPPHLSAGRGERGNTGESWVCCHTGLNSTSAQRGTSGRGAGTRLSHGTGRQGLSCLALPGGEWEAAGTGEGSDSPHGFRKKGKGLPFLNLPTHRETFMNVWAHELYFLKSCEEPASQPYVNIDTLAGRDSRS